MLSNDVFRGASAHPHAYALAPRAQSPLRIRSRAFLKAPDPLQRSARPAAQGSSSTCNMRSDGRALVDSAPGLGVSMRRAEVLACARVACSVESAKALDGASGTRKSIVQ